MKKVLLVGIYDINTAALAPEMLRAYASQFPIGQRYDIRTLNLSIFTQSAEMMTEAIQAEKADIVGFSAYVWNIELIKKIVPRISGIVLVGGPQCNGEAENLLADLPNIDVIVSGEGEEAFKELLEYYAGDRALETILGVTTKGRRTAPRESLVSLDALASPYARIFRERPNLDWIAYETSRGCPFLCGFCTWGYSKTMRYHSLDRVFADLDVLLAQPSLKRIYLCDSSILLEKSRAKSILRRIISRKRDVVLRYEFNAEHLDDEIIDLLLQLPDNEFNFGVQTTNPRALKIMRRPFDRRKFESNFEKMALRTERTTMTMDVIYGLPGDDLEGFKSSLNYVMSFDRVDWILTNPLILLPGSDFHHDSAAHGIRLRDRESGIVESTATFTPEQMREAVKISFWTSTIYFNARLREAFRAHAVENGIRIVDALVEFFEGLPFSFSDDGAYPYMVPSVAEDFRKRNLAIFRVVSLYPRLVEAFRQYAGDRYDATLVDYERHFGEQYHRLSRFAEEEAARHALKA